MRSRAMQTDSVPITLLPSVHGVAAWSEDNIVAVQTEGCVTLKHMAHPVQCTYTVPLTASMEQAQKEFVQASAPALPLASRMLRMCALTFMLRVETLLWPVLATGILILRTLAGLYEKCCHVSTVSTRVVLHALMLQSEIPASGDWLRGDASHRLSKRYWPSLAQ